MIADDKRPIIGFGYSLLGSCYVGMDHVQEVPDVDVGGCKDADAYRNLDMYQDTTCLPKKNILASHVG